jgi:hypothetical protein
VAQSYERGRESSGEVDANFGTTGLETESQQETNSELKFRNKRVKGSQPFYNSSTTQSKNDNEAI